MALNNQDSIKLIKKSQLVSAADLEEAKKVSRHLNCLVTDVLLGRGLLTEDQWGEMLADYFSVPFINLKNIEIDRSTINLISEDLASKRKALVFKKENQTLHVAMADPKDLDLIELIKKASGGRVKVKIFVATHTGIKTAIEIYRQGAKTAEININSGDISIVNEIQRLLEWATRENASDIHFEVLEDRLLVRFRIDGVLHDQEAYPKSQASAFSARIKILSNLKLDEVRLPQDGQFTLVSRGGEKISFRVSILPTIYGEKVVLRLLESVLTGFNLDELGFLPEDQQLVSQVTEKIHGMCLVTGPTGSGKTTTLYTLLNLLNRPNVNIVTIEDPVENRLNRINQTQVHTGINFSFANGLRSILRQDPDVIMVGEIRDRETAVIATNASMTGHFVFSTVHANTSSSAIPRMVDLGVEPFLLASTLNLVIAQRLVRILCPKCKTPASIDPILQKKLDEIKNQIAPEIYALLKTNYHAVGCDYCYHTGYKGRIGIFELLLVTDKIKSLIMTKAPASTIWMAAREENTKSMLEDGIIKVARGLTTLEELFRVVAS